jgi:hypothetical protein
MLCFDSSLRNGAPWSPGRHIVAIVGSSIAVVRRDATPTVVHAATLATDDPLTIGARVFDACARYDVRAVHALPDGKSGVDAGQRPRRSGVRSTVIVPEPLRVRHAEPEASARVLAPAIDLDSADLLDAIELAASVAARLPAPKAALPWFEQEAIDLARRRLRSAFW